MVFVWIPIRVIRFCLTRYDVKGFEMGNEELFDYSEVIDDE
jgi:hypothetical protein